MTNKTKPVYMYDTKYKFIMKFETTQECADYFDKDREYINHSIYMCAKIRKDGKWYRLSREKI